MLDKTLQFDIQPVCMIVGKGGDKSTYHGSWITPTIFWLPATLRLALKTLRWS